jgi:uncharacterized protein
MCTPKACRAGERGHDATMQSFTPLAGLIGGLMIGTASALFLLLAGRISGISGILEGAMRPSRGLLSWQLAYLVGLPLGTLLMLALAPSVVSKPELPSSWGLLAMAGLLVGYGARLGGGCTSGHGVCGISRLSPRSIVATCVFMAVAALVVFLMRHVLQMGAA